MKRAEGLKRFSSDHHTALLWAKRAKKCVAEQAATTALWQQLEVYNQCDLAPHIVLEERLLIPHLRALGEQELVSRLLDEHAALRACFVSDAERSHDALCAFATLLEQHVRFEERELFNTLQRRLGADLLASIGEACSPAVH